MSIATGDSQLPPDFDLCRRRLLEAVSEVTGIDIGYLAGRTRGRPEAHARALLVTAACRIWPGKFSSPMIGAMINRDHSTILHHRDLGQRLIKIDAQFAERLNVVVVELTEASYPTVLARAQIETKAVRLLAAIVHATHSGLLRWAMRDPEAFIKHWEANGDRLLPEPRTLVATAPAMPVRTEPMKDEHKIPPVDSVPPIVRYRKPPVTRKIGKASVAPAKRHVLDGERGAAELRERLAARFQQTRDAS